MDPLRFAIAALPLGSYLIVLGLTQMRRRPMLTTGASDLGALGLAMSGLAFVGPVELFRPESATQVFGNWTWLFLLSLYWLALALATMLARPRLVAYNISADELRPAIAEAVTQLDPQARWAGDAVVLPQLGLQLHVDSFDFMRQASLVSSGGRQDLDGWRRLARSVSRGFRSIDVTPNPRAPGFLLVGGAIVVTSIFWMTASRDAVGLALSQVFAF